MQKDIHKSHLWKYAIQDDDCRVLMQFTGLKDKNRTEIFEGDVVRYIDKHSLMDSGIYKIGFNMGSFIIDDSPLIELFVHEDLHGWDVNIEVIGNIYNNPELLEDHD